MGAGITDCTTFRDQYDQGVGFQLDETEYQTWVEHLDQCSQCSNWHQEMQVIARGHNVKDFACVHLAYHVTQPCPQHEDPWDCPDVVVMYFPRFDDYGIPIRNGGSAVMPIQHCPWCGVQLPDSKRRRWYAELEALGIEDPWIAEIPEEYNTDQWWREGEE